MAQDVIELAGKAVVVTAGAIVAMKVYGKIQYAKGYVEGYKKGKSSVVADAEYREV